jgi:hypothetical protein
MIINTFHRTRANLFVFGGKSLASDAACPSPLFRRRTRVAAPLMQASHRSLHSANSTVCGWPVRRYERVSSGCRSSPHPEMCACLPTRGKQKLKLPFCPSIAAQDTVARNHRGAVQSRTVFLSRGTSCLMFKHRFSACETPFLKLHWRIRVTIRTFIDSAVELHALGRHDVALALACAAIDATAAKAFPNVKESGRRYKSFLKRSMSVVIKFGFPGIEANSIRIKCINIPDLKKDAEGYVGIEDIIYHVVRCGLIHQCEIDSRVVFTDRTELGNFGTSFRVPKQLISGLICAVKLDRINAAEFLNEDPLQGSQFLVEPSV